MKIAVIILSLLLQSMPFLNLIQKRDSILVGDTLEYGVTLEDASDTLLYGWPQISQPEGMDELFLARPWEIDTLNVKRSSSGIRSYTLRGSFVIQPFEEGIYELPPLSVLRRHKDGTVDTLFFEPLSMDVKTIPIDTTTFVPHDLRPQIRYPVTFKEVLPWVLGALGIAGVIALAVFLILRFRKAKDEPKYKEPAHIRALRKLDHYRSNKFWAPDKQKQFYSGVTDALREYMASRYGIGAMEMTSAEIFRELKESDIPAGLYGDLKELFERADFVKFAKYVADDEENAGVLPLSVRFVSETYIKEEEEGNVL